MNPERTYYPSGQIWYEQWKNEAGEFHRLDGPARRGWHLSGRLGWEEWCINGERHRLDGPAVRYWRENGRPKSKGWFINGVQYETKAEFQVAVDLYKANEIAELF